jgi:molybdopterin-guanine dinucleotide biosynthesis protein A
VELVGAVLAGGASRRMGVDKASLDVGGRTLAEIAVQALLGAGADPVLVVGDPPGSGRRVVAGATVVPDRFPGEGPLGGIVTALDAAVAVALAPTRRAGPHDEHGEHREHDLVVVVVACDMPAFDTASAAALARALGASPGAAAAAAVLDGRPQPLTAAWRPAVALPVLSEAFAAGERAPRRVLPRLDVVEVEGLDPWALHDVDRPEDLHRYADPAMPGGEHARPTRDTTEPT